MFQRHIKGWKIIGLDSYCNGKIINTHSEIPVIKFIFMKNISLKFYYIISCDTVPNKYIYPNIPTHVNDFVN